MLDNYAEMLDRAKRPDEAAKIRKRADEVRSAISKPSSTSGPASQPSPDPKRS